MDCTLKQFLCWELVVTEASEFWEFFECKIDFSSSAVVLNVFEFMVLLGGQDILSVLDHVEESDPVGAVTQYSFSFNSLSILEFNSNGLLIGIILNFSYFRIQPNLGPKPFGTVC